MAAKLLNKVLNFVGWEAEDEDEDELEVQQTELKEERAQPHFMQTQMKKQVPQPNKVVNIHAASQQFRVVIMQPENFDDAQEICDHLKTKKPVVINLEEVEKDLGQRILDFLSGAVYALDGNIQKVSTGIFVIAPNNVDLQGEFKDELRSKGVFPWAK